MLDNNSIDSDKSNKIYGVGGKIKCVWMGNI